MKIKYIDKVPNSERKNIDGGDNNFVIHSDIDNIHDEVYNINGIAKLFWPLNQFLAKSVVISVSQCLGMHFHLIQYTVEINNIFENKYQIECITHANGDIEFRSYMLTLTVFGSNNGSQYIESVKIIGTFTLAQITEGINDFPFQDILTDCNQNSCNMCIYRTHQTPLWCAVNPNSFKKCREFVSK